jgi:O-antigen/teichoic acid export membrane protein
MFAEAAVKAAEQERLARIQLESKVACFLGLIVCLFICFIYFFFFFIYLLLSLCVCLFFIYVCLFFLIKIHLYYFYSYNHFDFQFIFQNVYTISEIATMNFLLAMNIIVFPLSAVVKQREKEESNIIINLIVSPLSAVVE